MASHVKNILLGQRNYTTFTLSKYSVLEITLQRIAHIGCCLGQISEVIVKVMVVHIEERRKEQVLIFKNL